MEFIEVVKDIICNVGFPIFMVVVLLKEMEDERAAHREESDKWVEAFNSNTEALNNNTRVMEKVIDRVGG